MQCCCGTLKCVKCYMTSNKDEMDCKFLNLVMKIKLKLKFRKILQFLCVFVWDQYPHDYNYVVSSVLISTIKKTRLEHLK